MLVSDGIDVVSVALPTIVTDGDPEIMGVGINVSEGNLVGETPDNITDEADDGTDVPNDSISDGSSDPSSDSSTSVSVFVELFAASAYCSQ